MARIRIEGLDDLERLLKVGDRKVTAAAKRAVTEIATDVAARADDLVPFDEGTLSASQRVDLPSMAVGSRVEASIQYGGPAAPYAVVQHENLDLWHPPKPPGKSKVGGRQGTGPVEPGTGRGPKYLEHPLMEQQPKFGDRLIRLINEELAK